MAGLEQIATPIVAKLVCRIGRLALRLKRSESRVHGYQLVRLQWTQRAPVRSGLEKPGHAAGEADGQLFERSSSRTLLIIHESNGVPRLRTGPRQPESGIPTSV